MEQHNIVLRGVATVLNAFGSGLVTAYDLAASTLGKVLPGEKDKLKGQIREYEKKIEQLYFEVGKEVSKEGDLTHLTAAGETALSLIAEHRQEIEKIQENLQAIEEAERREKERALREKERALREKERVLWEKESAERMKKAEPVEMVRVAVETSSVAEKRAPVAVEPAPEEKIEKAAETEEILAAPSLAETVVSSVSLVDLETKGEKETLAQEVEPPAEALAADTPEPEVSLEEATPSLLEMETEKEALAEPPEAPQVKPAKYTRELLGNKLKGDLLALCTEKGITADRSMTKAEIIELLLKVK